MSFRKEADSERTKESWSKEFKTGLLGEYDNMKEEIEKLREKNELLINEKDKIENEWKSAFISKNQSQSQVRGDKSVYTTDLDYNRQDGKGYKLDPNTPKYGGKPEENLEEWMIMIINNIKMAAIPGNLHLACIGNYVKDTAAKYIFHI